MDAQARKYALDAQRTEISEYQIYKRLARKTRNAKNAEVLNRIAEQEKQHAAYWELKTGQQVKSDKWRLYRTLLLARFLGLSFALKLMEEKEGTGADNYVRQAK
ncbi:ferritin family protein [Thermophagus sp. OGC60D27]|uniref:ferritin family protein n=1 Tax=Thermophagus sp. OGC60D27 TaxID=3458415 RepID=UPI0040383FB1